MRLSCPRLSTRLHQKLFGETASAFGDDDDSILGLRRVEELQRRQEEDRFEFSLQQFMETAGTATESQEIKAAYLEFVKIVAEQLSSCEERDMARVVYNICSPSSNTNANATSASKGKGTKQKLVAIRKHFGSDVMNEKITEQLTALSEVLHKVKSNDGDASIAPPEPSPAFKLALQIKFAAPALHDLKVDFFDSHSHGVDEQKRSDSEYENEIESDKEMNRGRKGGDDMHMRMKYIETLDKEKEDVVDGSGGEGAAWLLQLCAQHVSAVPDSLMEPSAMAEEILRLCQQQGELNIDIDMDSLQGNLFELVGETGFELMFEVMGSVDRIRPITAGDVRKAELAASMSHISDKDEECGIGGFGEGGASSSSSSFSSTQGQVQGQGQVASTSGASTNVNASLSGDYSISTNQRIKKEKREREQQERQAKQIEAMRHAQILEIHGGTLPSASGDSSIDWLKEVGFDDDFLMQVGLCL